MPGIFENILTAPASLANKMAKAYYDPKGVREQQRQLENMQQKIAMLGGLSTPAGKQAVMEYMQQVKSSPELMQAIKNTQIAPEPPAASLFRTETVQVQGAKGEEPEWHNVIIRKDTGQAIKDLGKATPADVYGGGGGVLGPFLEGAGKLPAQAETVISSKEPSFFDKIISQAKDIEAPTLPSPASLTEGLGPSTETAEAPIQMPAHINPKTGKPRKVYDKSGKVVGERHKSGFVKWHTRQELDEKMARRILQSVGGDEEKAKNLAKQLGYTWSE